ncbi:MAG: 50S ribosomal protein L17 [Opitutales bacterium]|nr:50S ribosomal protein L17 [Opitutales bacterium]MCH8539870.1 50S ribosomal protein L17 [Opitutales bacterium]
MRHLKHKNQLGVKKEHRQALIANLASALITEGRIRTTLKKAKALRPFIEKIITLAKKGTLHHRRIAISRVRDVHAINLLFDEKAEDFKGRTGGYTRIYKLGNRIGDAAEMALIELVPAEDEGYGKRNKRGGGKKAAPVKAEAKAQPAETEAPAKEEAQEASAPKAEAAEEKPEAKAEEPAPEAAEETTDDEKEKK